jgi:copper homeostasis protein
MTYKLEVIGFNISSCIIAQESGAHRIELCDGPGEGGTTPSMGFIKTAREKLSIELYPIIRPRGGDFLYSEDEFHIMKTDVLMCKKMGCDGIVMGILNTDGSVDKDRCSKLIEVAYPLGVTFHRAFDRTNDAEKALEDIIEIGCERILTSGLRPNALEGIEMLSRLVQLADERIIIMPGSGVRSDNIAKIAENTGAVEFHSSARINSNTSMQYINELMQEKLAAVSIDKKEITAMLHALKNIEITSS